MGVCVGSIPFLPAACLLIVLVLVIVVVVVVGVTNFKK